MVAPRSAASRLTKPPAITSVSLFARATVFLGVKRRPGTRQAGAADDRREHDIDFRCRSDFRERIAANEEFRSGGQINPIVLLRQFLVRRDDPPRFKLAGLLHEFRQLAICGEGSDPQSAFAGRNDFQCVRADASRRTEHCDIFHGSCHRSNSCRRNAKRVESPESGFATCPLDTIVTPAPPRPLAFFSHAARYEFYGNRSG